jgi:hypothetical protein
MTITERIQGLDNSRRQGLLQTYRGLLHKLLENDGDEDVISSINNARLALAFEQAQVENDLKTLRRFAELNPVADAEQERHKAAEAIRKAIEATKNDLTEKTHAAMREFKKWNDNREVHYVDGNLVAEPTHTQQGLIGEKTEKEHKRLRELNAQYATATYEEEASRAAITEIEKMQANSPHLGLQ